MLIPLSTGIGVDPDEVTGTSDIEVSIVIIEVDGFGGEVLTSLLSVSHQGLCSLIRGPLI